MGGGEDWGAWGAQCGFGQVEELGWELDTVGSWYRGLLLELCVSDNSITGTQHCSSSRR